MRNKFDIDFSLMIFEIAKMIREYSMSKLVRTQPPKLYMVLGTIDFYENGLLKKS